jgi:hypothetical protein
MEIRQIKKEIDIRPASYLDENAENTEKYYLSLKCMPKIHARARVGI